MTAHFEAWVPRSFGTAKDPLPGHVAHLRIARTRPGSDTIRISVARIMGKPGGIPLFVCPGGPGGPALWNIDARPRWFRKMAEVGDVYLIEQRGAGNSQPLIRKADPVLLGQDGAVVSRAARDTALQQMFDRDLPQIAADGLDVRWFTLPEIAQDVIDVAQAIGVERFNLHGYSFGTQVCATLLRDHPDRLARVVMWGYEPLDCTWKHPADLSRHLQRAAAAAKQEARLGRFLADVQAQALELKARFDQTPVHARFQCSVTNRQRRVRIDGLLVQAVMMSTLMRKGIRTLPLQFFLLKYWPQRLAALYARMWLADVRVANWQTVFVDGSTGVADERASAILEERDRCAMGDLPNSAIEPLRSRMSPYALGPAVRTVPDKVTVPCYLYSGTLDGNTPVENAEAFCRHHSHAHHLVITGLDHDHATADLHRDFAAVDDDIARFLRGEDPQLLRLHYPLGQG